MRAALTLAVFLPVAALAQDNGSAPFKLDFPLEIGSLARKDVGAVPIVVYRVPMRDLQKMPGGCRPGVNEVTIGCSLHGGNRTVCEIYVPIEVDDIDALKIEVHERRHCLGQEHITIRGPDGTKMLRWLP